MSKPGLIRRASARLARRFSLPLMIGGPRLAQIVPTNACNLRCRACPKTHYKTDSRHMAPEVYKRICDQVLPHVQAVHLQGLGEPTLSPLFGQMIEDAIRLDLSIAFVTNTTKLSEEHMKRLLRARAQITISLDGATPETHEHSRPGSDFAQIIEVLHQLKDLRCRNSDHNLNVCLSTVVTTYNIAEIPGILRLAAENDIGIVSLVTPGMGERSDEFAQATIGHHREMYCKYLPEIQKAEKETGVQVIMPLGISGSSDNHSEDEKLGNAAALIVPSLTRKNRRIFPQKCSVPFHEMYFDVDGSVRPCCRAVWISMGNILNDPVSKIWNNAHYRMLRRTVNSNNPPDFCRTCTLCGGITGGEENYLESLYARGFPPLPAPPKIGQ